MTEMNAAVVSTYGEPPRYGPFPTPAAASEHETLVDVVAAGLHPRVRTGARGAHYSGRAALPMVPGIDAVGRRDDGTLVYFAAADDVMGTMAERAVLDDRRAIELPADVDAVRVAAAMNPAMSSWVALRRRASLQAGQSVLVLGATGNAGTMAVHLAGRLGAGRVVGAGRDRTRLDALAALGADETVQLTGDFEASDAALAAAAADVDLVLDYLWGEPARRAMAALLGARADRSQPLDWVQIGAVAGPEIALPSVLLRSANLRIQGSGQGSVAPRTYLGELPALVAEICSDTFPVTPRAVPLAEVQAVWTRSDAPGERTVLVP